MSAFESITRGLQFVLPLLQRANNHAEFGATRKEVHPIMITFDEQISVDQHVFEYQLTRVAFRHRTATLHTLRVCIRDSNDQNDEICDKLIWDVNGIRIRIIQYTYTYYTVYVYVS